jgi:hypothetical protein
MIAAAFLNFGFHKDFTSAHRRSGTKFGLVQWSSYPPQERKTRVRIQPVKNHRSRYVHSTVGWLLLRNLNKSCEHVKKIRREPNVLVDMNIRTYQAPQVGAIPALK